MAAEKQAPAEDRRAREALRRLIDEMMEQLRDACRRDPCGSVCHGTMTMWYNHRFRGAALTVEYGPRPARYRMRVRAPRQVLSIWGARRG